MYARKQCCVKSSTHLEQPCRKLAAPNFAEIRFSFEFSDERSRISSRKPLSPLRPFRRLASISLSHPTAYEATEAE